MTELTYWRVRSLFHYDPATGDLFRLKASKYQPSVVGRCSDRDHGHKTLINVDGKKYKKHRLIWLWMTGALPPTIVDHKNRIPTDNAWDNLRLANNSQNRANSKKRAHQRTANFKGVTKRRRGYVRRPWVAQIRANGKARHIGYFATELEAHAAYMEAARCYFGEFATNGEPVGT